MAKARRASRLRLVAIASGVAVAFAACGREESGPAQPVSLKKAAPGSGCGDVVRFPDEGRAHLGKGEKGSYRTQPPTSGKHGPSWGPTGTYAKELPNEVQVHNLEHGHVVIQYVPGTITPALLADLTKIAVKDPAWVLLAPRSADRFVPAAALAFTAWTVSQACDAPTMTALGEAREFVRAHVKKGPEKVPGKPISETPPAT